MILKKHASFFKIFLAIALLFIFLMFSSSAADSAKNGIYRCINTVIPTLFPIFVINGLLINSGAAYRITRILARPIKKIFGIEGIGVYPTVIGLICGAPSGCIALSSMLENDDIRREEASIIAVVSSPISFSFLYATVGAKMLASQKLGMILYLIGVISSVISGRIISSLIKNKTNKESIHRHSFSQNPSFSLSRAISGAVSSILSISGAIVFFSSLSGLICAIPDIPFFVKAFSTIFLEITSGAEAVTVHLSKASSFLFLCAGAGWSGLSIISQCLSAVGKKASLGLFLVGKCINSLISLLLGYLLTLFMSI